MNRDIAMRWAEALESGEYVKGTKSLRKGDEVTGFKYCCLGVLTDLARQEGVVEDWKLVNTSVPTWSIQGNGGTLCHPVQDWAEMLMANFRTDGRVSLVTLNDSLGKTFAEIAAVIREEWELL